jgi:TPP-dependent indolepyruvate ferredoxin oxidoreductase alpha subunit
VFPAISLTALQEPLVLKKDTGMCTSCGGCRLALTCWQLIGLKESSQYIQHLLARFCLCDIWCVVNIICDARVIAMFVNSKTEEYHVPGLKACL